MIWARSMVLIFQLYRCGQCCFYFGEGQLPNCRNSMTKYITLCRI